MNTRGTQPPKLRYLLLALYLFFFLALGASESFRDMSGYSALRGKALQAATEFSRQTGEVFLALSTLKALLAVIEGSTMGVSLGANVALEVGDIIQPAYDYLDFSWELMLSALLLNSGYELLFSSNLLTLGFWLAALGVFLYVVTLPLTTNEQDRQRAGRRLVVVGLLLSLGVPLLFITSSAVSRHFTAAIRAETLIELNDTAAKVSQAKDIVFSLRERLSVASPLESIRAVFDSLAEVCSSLAKTFYEILLATLKYVLATFIDLAALPLLLAWLGFRLCGGSPLLYGSRLLPRHK
jgi:hypothetical protein